MTDKNPLGPNFKKLIAHKVSVDAVPAGGGIQDALNFLTSKSAISAGFVLASNWVKAAINAIREAADPNPYKNSTDEEIAGELLRRIEAKKNA